GGGSGRGWRGNRLRSCDLSMSQHGQAGHSTSCDTRVPRSHAPPPLSPPGTRPRRLPPTRAPPNGTSAAPDEPASSSGRDRGHPGVSGPARDHDARAQPLGPAGSVPPESEYVLGTAADRSASRHHGRIAPADRPREPSPLEATPLLTSTIAVDWSVFSLDYRNLIRVRPLELDTSHQMEE